MSKIDIIIPIYNQVEKLDACLKSIFSQTFQDFSVIVVDDGSTDNLDKVLEKFSGDENSNSRLRVIKQSHQGASAARNRGAKETSSEFILFCDADIIMKKNMLEAMFNALQNNQRAAYAYSSFRFGMKTFKLWPFDAARLRQMPYIHTSSLIRRIFFPGFDEKLRRFQDWDLWLTMLEAGHTGTWVSELLFKVKSGGTISKWMPSFAYKILKNNKNVIQYNQAVKIIKEKHGLK